MIVYYNGLYLEVQRFNGVDGHINHPEWNGKSEHIGYMNLIHICVH